MALYELLKNIINKLGLAVRTDAQTLSDEQKNQARINIGAMSADAVSGIIDVIELPTEDINENALYRKLIGVFVYNQGIQDFDKFKCYCVKTLPETGEAVTQTMSDITAYYNVQDGVAYGYINDVLASSAGVPAGWYPLETLAPSFGVGWGGIITDINDDPCDDTQRILLQYEWYSYKNIWMKLEYIGRSGTGTCAEVFNHISNVASGNNSHAEGLLTQASGRNSHAEGESTHALGSVSHAEGLDTVAACRFQHVQGTSNIIDPEYNADYPERTGKYAHIVGNGGMGNTPGRSNAHTLDWNGLGWFAGGLKVGGTGQDDENAKEVALKEDIPQQVQADYAQNDPSAPNYVKNRLAWTDYSKVEVMLEKTFTIDSDTNNSRGEFGLLGFEVGKIYNVNWNGVDYICKCNKFMKDDTVFLYLGNIGLHTLEESDSNEPFFIADIAKYNLTNFSFANGAGNYTVSIDLLEETAIHKLDEKYIPDSVKNVQADYEQYDNTKPDYIKNRLAYQDYDNIVYEYGKEDTILPFKVNTLQDLIGLKVVDKNKGRRMAVSPKRKPLNEMDLLIDGQNLIIAYTNYGDYLSKPCICMMGNEMYSVCPSFFTENNNKYNALFYAFEETTDNLGLGLTFNQGWHAINTTNFSNEAFDISKNPIFMSDSYFVEHGKNKSYLTDLFPLREEIEYTITEDNILSTDDAVAVVSFFKISDIDLNILDENIQYIHRAYSFIFNIDNNSITAFPIGAFYDEIWYKNIIIFYPTEIHKLDAKFIPDSIPNVQSAEIGQTLIVKSVDENGKPTEWETKQALPQITEADNGKFLRVVAGQWSAQTVPNAEEARF